MAVGGDGTLIYDGSSWSKSLEAPGENYPSAVSCSTTHFCAAVDASGYAQTYSNSSATDYPLTVTTAGTGSGTVECESEGSGTAGACAREYAEGASVVLRATASSGAVFAGWSGEGCSGTGICKLTMSAARSVTATFNSASTTSHGEEEAKKSETGATSGGSTSASAAQVDTKGSEPQPAPIVGQSQTVGVTTGTVTVRLKGTSKFVPLSGASTIPDGSEVEATNGHVRITVATPNGHIQSAEVWGGRFLIEQEHTGSGETRFILSLPLTGCSSTARKPHAEKALASDAGHSKHGSGPTSRHLWVSEEGGSWGTTGRYVSTSVEGTRWLTLDECTRSVVKVAAGKVKVDDLVHHKTKTLTAGKSYVARRG